VRWQLTAPVVKVLVQPATVAEDEDIDGFEL
jgi:hypothetical protein